MKDLFWKFRIAVLYITAFFILMFFSILSMLLMWLPYRMLYYILVKWSSIAIFLSKYICGLKYEVIGKENIPKDALVVLCNHQTMWDTIIMEVILPPQTWVLKKELFSIPFFGWLLRTLKPIAIDRKKSSSVRQLISQGIARLKENIFIIIYPESTRIPVDAFKKFSRSGAALAIAANKNILPIAHNAGKFWPKSLLIKSPGTIKIVIGKEISTEGKDATQVTDEAETWINNKRRELD